MEGCQRGVGKELSYSDGRDQDRVGLVKADLVVKMFAGEQAGNADHRINEASRDRDCGGIEKDGDFPIAETPGRKERFDSGEKDRSFAAIR